MSTITGLCLWLLLLGLDSSDSHGREGLCLRASILFSGLVSLDSRAESPPLQDCGCGPGCCFLVIVGRTVLEVKVQYHSDCVCGQPAVSLVLIGWTVLKEKVQCHKDCVCGQGCCSLILVAQAVLQEKVHYHRNFLQFRKGILCFFYLKYFRSSDY